MKKLEQIYTAEFFKEWGKKHIEYVSSAELITNVLYENYRPQRMVDLGCGCGVYGHFFDKYGVEVVSIDGVEPTPKYSFIDQVELRDLTVRFDNIWGKFDLALCFDVGEHIPEELCRVFLENITQFSDLLLMSCAPPKQGGVHHVNEQPKRYWIEKLAQHGFAYQRKLTGVLCETFKIRRPHYMWMSEHISVYHKK
jgi:hypothetical protein